MLFTAKQRRIREAAVAQVKIRPYNTRLCSHARVNKAQCTKENKQGSFILNTSRISWLTQLDPSSLGIPRGGASYATGVYKNVADFRGRRCQQSGNPKCEGYSSKCKGYSLCEVLIATLIFSFSLLALTHIAVFAWQRLYDSYFTSLAASMASNRMESSLSGDDAVYHDAWKQYLPSALPHGSGFFSKQKTGSSIQVCWRRLLNHQNICYGVAL